MVTVSRIAIAATLLWGVPAFSQVAQDRDHSAHHPGGATAQQQPMQRAVPQGQGLAPGMTGGTTMGAPTGNASAPGPTGAIGMMPMTTDMAIGVQVGAEHIEARLAFIKAELKITENQTQQWNAFADAVRGNIGSMTEMRKSMMSGQGHSSALPERLALEDKMIAAHLAALRKIEDAVAQLYGVLTDEQKKIADTIVTGPMGMPMGMM